MLDWAVDRFKIVVRENKALSVLVSVAVIFDAVLALRYFFSKPVIVPPVRPVPAQRAFTAPADADPLPELPPLPPELSARSHPPAMPAPEAARESAAEPPPAAPAKQPVPPPAARKSTVTPVKTRVSAPATPRRESAAPAKRERRESKATNRPRIRAMSFSETMAGPKDRLPFVLTGTGFDEAFLNTVQVNSGHPSVTLKDLSLTSPTEIAGTLVVSKDAYTQSARPQILVNDAVAFQSAEPLFIIRPGDVLTTVLLNRTPAGKRPVRILTNVSPRQFKRMSLTQVRKGTEVNVPLAQISQYVVEGALDEDKVLEYFVSMKGEIVYHSPAAPPAKKNRR